MGLALMIIVLCEMIHSERKGTAALGYFQIILKKNASTPPKTKKKVSHVGTPSKCGVMLCAIIYFSSSATAASAVLSAMTFSM